jgi:hypothetical protein
VVVDIAGTANEETARLIEQSGGRAVAVRCDVTRPEDVQPALQKAVVTASAARVVRLRARRVPGLGPTVDVGRVADPLKSLRFLRKIARTANGRRACRCPGSGFHETRATE